MSKYKIILLSLCWSFYAQGNSLDNACLSVQKLTSNKLSFFYNPKDKLDKPYFYIKAEIGTNLLPINLEDLNKGSNLRYLPNTNPPIYQIPENAKKLIILKSPSKLEKIESDAQIEPIFEIAEIDSALLAKRPRRNVTNYPQPLPPESNQLVDNHNDIRICELLL
jgi:hypothetical protein